MVLHIKPLGSPISYLLWLILDVRINHFRSQLKIRPSNSGYGCIVGIWIQSEQSFEQIEMGMNSKESFVQMHEDRKMKDGIGGKMV